ncbi:MAG: transcriptional regulator, LysR family [Rhodospirillales bacterium]|jgi:hypothetical protein|nr:transcriptional regulator, LysR family [Rhodospirillales bacterium]
MLDLNDFRYFVRIVGHGGLTAASRDLNISKSTVSYRLQQPETSLGVRLINRTAPPSSCGPASDLPGICPSSASRRIADLPVGGRLQDQPFF